jgi:flagellar biosynthetic protein FliR
MIDLGPILDHLPAWLMVLFRLSGIFILAPVLGSQVIPRQVKIYLVITLSLCIYPMLLDPGRPSAVFLQSVINQGLSLWTLIPQIATELLLGFVVGYAASLPLIGMQMGGHVIDQQIGLGLAGVFNPDLNEQAGIVGEIFFMVAIAIFAILGGHRLMLACLITSFDHIPLGTFAGFASLVQLSVGLLAVMLELAIRIAAPLLCLIFLETVTLGFIARTIPQINILSVGFPLRIMIGTSFLVLFVAVAIQSYIQTLNRVLYQILTFFSP